MEAKDLARVIVRRALAKKELASEREAEAEITQALLEQRIPFIGVWVDFLENGNRQAEFSILTEGMQCTQKVLCTNSMLI